MTSSEKPHLVYLLRGFEEQFGRSSEFCDVRFFGYEDKTRQRSEVVRCHSVILMSLSPLLKRIFRTHHRRNKFRDFDGEGFDVTLPDEISTTELRDFLRVVYRKMSHVDLGGEVIYVPENIVKGLQIRVSVTGCAESSSSDEFDKSIPDVEADQAKKEPIVVDENGVPVEPVNLPTRPNRIKRVPKAFREFSVPDFLKQNQHDPDISNESNENDKNTFNRTELKTKQSTSVNLSSFTKDHDGEVEDEEEEEEEEEDDVREGDEEVEQGEETMQQGRQTNVKKRISAGKRKELKRQQLSARRDAHGFVARIGRFVCSHGCGELFKSKFAMERHVKMNHDNGEDETSTYMCEVCGVEKDSSASLNSHMSTHKEYKCEYCGENIMGRYVYKRHIENKHSERVKCDQCDKDFSNKRYLKKHYLTVHVKEEEKTLKCEFCEKRFAHPAVLRNHLIYCKPRDQFHVCQVCGKSFKLELLLRRHLETVHRVDGYTANSLPPQECDVCFKLFRDKALLTRHQGKVHTEDQKLPFPCEICDRKFPTVENLEDHKMVEHIGDKPHSCPDCPEKFATRPSFQYHMFFTHKSNQHSENFKCEICNKIFSSSGTLRAHERRIHVLNKEERKHVCDSCGKRFYRPYDLSLHIKVVHLKPGEYVCDVDDCGMTFNHHVYLKHHKARKHGIGRQSGQGDHYCDFCGRKFNFRSYLNVHIRSKHSAEEDRKFQCRFCDKRFALKSILNSHEKAAHTNTNRFQCGVENCDYHSFSKQSVIEHQARRHGIGIVTKPKKMPCKFCGKVLGNRSVLKRHIEVFHTKVDEKPFWCSYCGKRFREVYNKDEHEMAMHIKAEPYKCEVCGKGYNRAMSLRKHEKRVHQLLSKTAQKMVNDVRFDTSTVEDETVVATAEASETVENVIIFTS